MWKITCALAGLLVAFTVSTTTVSAAQTPDPSEIFGETSIQDMIKESMEAEHAVGMSVVITDGTNAYYTNSGYADKSQHIKATNETLYELGSTTKAFTALGILLLQEEGKLNIHDSVKNYIPWFQVYFEGSDTDITVEQLMNHQSGIPTEIMNQFETGTDRDLLEETVELTEDISLKFQPGTEFEYSNMNYEVLGYIIEQVTGEYFEDFMQENILKPLGMIHSTFYQADALETGELAQGYSNFFFGVREFDAPRYQGCLPDGWLITNTEDMAIWLNDQLGRGTVDGVLKELIAQSHKRAATNTVVADTLYNKNVYYSCGWFQTEDGSIFFHNGTNPNYSSRAELLMNQGVAICSISNMQGDQTENVVNNIAGLYFGYNDFTYSSTNAMLDGIMSLIIILELVAIAGVIYRIVEIKRKKALANPPFSRFSRCSAMGRGIVYTSILVFMCIWPYIWKNNFTTIYVYLPLTVLIMDGLMVLLMILLLAALIYNVASLPKKAC